MNRVHFCHTTNLKEIPHNFLAFVHGKTRDISKHIAINSSLQVALPEVKDANKLVNRRWVLVCEIIFNVFSDVPVAVFIKYGKQCSKLPVNTLHFSMIVKSSLEKQKVIFSFDLPGQSNTRQK